MVIRVGVGKLSVTGHTINSLGLQVPQDFVASKQMGVYLDPRPGKSFKKKKSWKKIFCFPIKEINGITD